MTPTRGRALRETLELFWSTADGYTKRRLLAALALVALGALLAAFTPVALKLLVDRLAASDNEADVVTGLVLLYVASQYLWRCSNSQRVVAHGRAEQRLRRRIGRRLFDHLVRMPLAFHVGQKAGAMGETAEQGLRGAQMVLQHLVFTILPVTVELSVVAIVLVIAGHPSYLAI